jgi:hypothetical protein
MPAPDLPGLKFVTHAKATLILNSAPGAAGHFKVKDDGHGGCKVIFVPLSAKPEAQKDVAKQDSDHHDSQSHAGNSFVVAEESFQFGNFGELGASNGGGMADLQHGSGHHELAWLFHAENQAADFMHVTELHHAHLLSLHDVLL